jgi:hypothetical protein
MQQFACGIADDAVSPMYAMWLLGLLQHALECRQCAGCACVQHWQVECCLSEAPSASLAECCVGWGQ